MGASSMSTVYDHLLTFPDEASAATALPQWRDGQGGWLPGPIVGAALIRAEAVWDGGDPPTLITPEDRVPGWTIDVMAFAPDPALMALGVPYLVADREAAARGEPFIVATSYSPAQIAGIKRVSPEPAGACYPFGATSI